jgi:hypothetical protein
MANTDITISKKDGVLVPSQSSVPAVQGNTVTFSSPKCQRDAVLFTRRGFDPVSGALRSGIDRGGREDSVHVHIV